MRRWICLTSVSALVLCAACTDLSRNIVAVDISGDGSEAGSSNDGGDASSLVDSADDNSSSAQNSTSAATQTRRDGGDGSQLEDASFEAGTASDFDAASEVEPAKDASSGDGGTSDEPRSTDDAATSDQARCDGGTCDAGDNVVFCQGGELAIEGQCRAPAACVALDDVLPSYPRPAIDAGSDAAASSPTAVCGFPPCIAALLDACKPEGSCDFNNFGAKWENDVYMKLQHAPTVETLFGADGAACLQATQNDVDGVDHYAWEDGCGNQVATGVWVRDFTLEVTCVEEGSVWMFDRSDAGCAGPSSSLSLTSYAYSGCAWNSSLELND